MPIVEKIRLGYSRALVKLLVVVTPAIAVFILGGQVAHASTYNVTNSSACTLSAAITASNTDSTSGSCAAGQSSNTINLASGTYTLAANLPNITTNALSIVGAGSEQTIINGQNLYNVFNNAAEEPFNVSDLTITQAGGAYDFAITFDFGTISNVVVRDSTAEGGIELDNSTPDTTPTFNNVAIVNNTTANLYSLYLALTAPGSTVNITNTTVAGNNAGGGGIFIDEDVSSDQGDVNLTNDTIANNVVESNWPAGLLIEQQVAGVGVYLENTILSNNKFQTSTPDNCGTGTFFGQPLVLPGSSGSNISSDGTCSTALNQTGDLNNTNADLGSLVLDNNTYVLPITYSSPAYNAGQSSGAPSTDQAGNTRPSCGGYDIGAYQTEACTPPVTYGNGAGSGEVFNPANDLPVMAVQGPNNLLYFYYQESNGSWGLTPMSGSGSTFAQPTVAFNPGNGLPVIVAEGFGNSLDYYYQQSNGSWGETYLAGTGAAYSSPSIAFNPSNDLPVIVSQAINNSMNYYYQESNSSWGLTSLSGSNSTFSAPSLYYNPSNDLPVIAFEGANNGLSFYYQQQGSGSWGYTPLSGSGSAFASPSLFYNPGNNLPVIAVESANNGLGFYYQQSNGSWGVTPLSGGGSVFSTPSLFYNPGNNLPVIAVESANNGLGFYYQQSNGSWGDTPLSGSGTTYSAPELAFNPSNNLPAIAIIGHSNNLQYVWQDGSGNWNGPIGL